MNRIILDESTVRHVSINGTHYRLTRYVDPPWRHFKGEREIIAEKWSGYGRWITVHRWSTS